MADKRCENGHFIDESWDLCPYCPQDAADADVPIVRPARVQEAQPRTAVPSAPARALPPPTPLIPRRDTANGHAAMPIERTIAIQKIAADDLQPARYVVGWLVGLNGSARGESYAVRMGKNVIGRDRRSDIVVNDDQASSHHADLVFRPEERRFILMDHNSTNGTYVNESEIEPRRDLSDRDVVRIGSHRFLFVPLCTDAAMWDDMGDLK
ncbi:MAG TPA: FHA domain-containing protein [Thermoanaerobaculia bacterium]|nr:FHA domain-containing protein [Thermoanaerobaculia bacterium]